MISGKGLWNSTIEQNMSNFEFNNDMFYTYDHMPSNLYGALKITASASPHKMCLEDNHLISYTYDNFITLVDEFSSYLVHVMKIAKGAHVGLLMQNSIEYCVAFFALSKIGAVTIALPSKYMKAEIESLVIKADAQYIICEQRYVSYFDDLSVPLIISSTFNSEYGFSKYNLPSLPPVKNLGNLEDSALIMFTSGTTSQSKAVLIRNYNIMHAVISYQRIFDIKPEDISIIATPIYHITGLIAILGLFVYAGGSLYLQKKFDNNNVLSCIENNHITFLHASPTVFYKLLELKDQYKTLKSLKKVACGSSNMPVEKLKQFHEWLPNVAFHTVYGLTESTSPATIIPYDAYSSPYIGSSGIPIPGIHIKIVDDNDSELGINKVGEILLRGSVIITDYYNTSQSGLEKENWLRTGDLGYVNNENYLYIVDRKKDMINRGGEKIWCFDIENELAKIPGIEQAAVVGIPHSLYGEVPAAIIKISSGYTYTYNEITAILSKQLAKYQIPEKIVFADSIPKTAGGKVDKKYIRKLVN